MPTNPALSHRQSKYLGIPATRCIKICELRSSESFGGLLMHREIGEGGSLVSLPSPNVILSQVVPQANQLVTAVNGELTTGETGYLTGANGVLVDFSDDITEVNATNAITPGSFVVRALLDDPVLGDIPIVISDRRRPVVGESGLYQPLDNPNPGLDGILRIETLNGVLDGLTVVGSVNYFTGAVALVALPAPVKNAEDIYLDFRLTTPFKIQGELIHWSSASSKLITPVPNEDKQELWAIADAAGILVKIEVLHMNGVTLASGL